MSKHPVDKGALGFIGVGSMGYPMVKRLLDCGLKPIIHDINKSAVMPLLERGASWADSPEEISRQAKIVLLSLPGPPQVEDVVNGPRGLLHTLAPDSIIVDLSTSSVTTSRKMAELCREQHIGFLDCPVTGGAKGCREGTLVLMVGGDSQLLEQVRPVLEALSRKIVYLGDSGAGNVAKLINNQLYLCGQTIFYEGLVLAQKAGLDLTALLDILDSSGIGGIHTKLAPRVLGRQYDGNIFTLVLAEKDVRLALEASRALEVEMPVTEAAHRLFEEARDAGFADKNFWSTIEIVERHAKTRIEEPNSSMEASDE